MHAGPAAADETSFTFTHTSGLQVTCTIGFSASAIGEEEGHWVANTRILSTDPRCEAGVEASLVYDDTYGNEQSATAIGQQDARLEVARVGGNVTSIHKAFFAQCEETGSNVCWTGEVVRRK